MLYIPKCLSDIPEELSKDYTVAVNGEECFVHSCRVSAIPFNTAGIDFCMTALFVTICVEQWLNAKEHLPAIVGFAASVICLIIFGKDSFLIPSMLVISLLLICFKGKIGRESNDE